MKTRSGFVSNSSSSSFVIAMKKGQCPCCGADRINLFDALEVATDMGMDDESEIVAKGALSIIEYIKSNSCYHQTDYEYKTDLDNAFVKIKKAESDGNQLGYVRISYHDNNLRQLFDQLVESKLIEIVWKEDN